MSSITININKDDIEKMWDIKFTDEQWLKFVKEKQAQVSGSCFDWLRDEREYYINSDDEEAEKKGYNTITVDILEKFNPTHLTDILEWDYKQYPQHYFHIIWASPNCKDYSRMNFLSKKKRI